MQKLRLACLALLLTTGLAQAATPCNGFEIKITNNTSDDLLINKIDLQGADIEPGGIEKLDAGSTQAFTVNNSQDGKKMQGNFEFHSISLPSKEVNIKFDLDNKEIFCEHNDTGSNGDYPVDTTRLVGNVTYTIG